MACWHGDVYLEVVLGPHTLTYLCILLGCFRDVLQNNMGNGNYCDLEIEPEGNGALGVQMG
jgi:hypothetical protein